MLTVHDRSIIRFEMDDPYGPDDLPSYRKWLIDSLNTIDEMETEIKQLKLDKNDLQRTIEILQDQIIDLKLRTLTS